MTRGRFSGAAMALTTQRAPLWLAYRTAMFDLLMPPAVAIAAIARFQPDIVVGYPSALQSLAEAQRRGEIDIRPERLQRSGEMVLPSQRQVIEGTFGRPLLNVYSSTENLLMGVAPGGRRGHAALRG